MNRRAFLASTALAALIPRTSLASPVSEAAADLGDAQFIALGERHDNPEHHRLQAELVAALKPSALAFEMIPQAQEATVNQMRADGASVAEIGDAIDWANNGWPDWVHYAPILEAAPDAYVAGGGLPKSMMGRLYTAGAAGLGSEMTERYGLAEALPGDVLTEMLDEQFAAHCELIEREKLSAMVEIQRAWDASYAEAWARAADEGGGRSVLICGNVHAQLDRGAPAALRHAQPDARIASVGLLEEGDHPAPDGLYTVTISAPKPDREDPCDQMREAMGKD